MVGLEGLLPTWELRLAASVAIAIVAVGLSWVIHRIRRALEGRIRAVALDLVSSTAIAAIVIATALVTASLWGQLETLLDQLGFLRLDERAPQVTITIVIVIAVQVFVGIARRLLDDLTTESNALSTHQQEISMRLTQLTLWGLGLLIILGIWDVDLTGILVGAGFLGIVLGLASRQTLGSLIAGLVLMLSRPFEVGEWITVGDKEGMVTDITLMSTRLRSINGERVIVPNDVITGEIVTNRSREGRLRTEVEIGIDYDDDVGTAAKLAEAAAVGLAETADHVLEAPQPTVLLRSLGDSAVILGVRVWIDKPSPRHVNRIRHDLFTRVKAAFQDADITIPFPQRELSARAETDLTELAADRGATEESQGE